MTAVDLVLVVIAFLIAIGALVMVERNRRRKVTWRQTREDARKWRDETE